MRGISFSHRRIRDPETKEIYLERWNLDFFGLFSLKIHRIPREDFGRDLHDHPWRFTSVVLWGGYCEVLYRSKRQLISRNYFPGAILRRTTEDRHKIISVFGTAWTFVVCGPRVRTWGFWTSAGFVPWYSYEKLGDQDQEP